MKKSTCTGSFGSGNLSGFWGGLMGELLIGMPSEDFYPQNCVIAGRGRNDQTIFILGS